MPSQDRKRPQDLDKESKVLSNLLDLINTPASKQKLPSLSFEHTKTDASHRWPLPQPKSGENQQLSSEAYALELFSLKYQNERHFSEHSQTKLFSNVFSALIRKRLCSEEWTGRAPPENISRMLTCVRILMRDPSNQKHMFDLGGVKVLADNLKKATDSYLMYGEGPYVVEILKEMTNIFQKLAAVPDQRDWLIACGVHKTLVLLLSAGDVIVLHCSVHALITLAQSPRPRQLIGELNCIEVLLRIIQEYDNLSKKLAANLLRILCQDSQTREMVKLYDGIPILLSQLHSENVNLLWHVVWCLVQLCEDQEISNDIRQMGGDPPHPRASTLHTLLHYIMLEIDDIPYFSEKKFVTERSETSDASASCAGTQFRTPPIVDDLADIPFESGNMFHTCGTLAVTRLPRKSVGESCVLKGSTIFFILQRNAFRSLRFLFSMERNRRLFKRLFPADLFAMFIDVGHYNRELAAYKPLVEKMNKLPSVTVDEIRSNILELNQNKAPTHYIGDYAVFELLGSGAFGTVYKVRKRSAGQSFQAIKEVNLQNPAFGKNSQERDKSVGVIISELSIIKEQLKHPNIVRYHKTFMFFVKITGDKLYIVMSLIEGAPLADHFTSLKEKKERFPEGRIWNIFLQMVLALRYLHKEKNIVHRDLTPNNIMLGENDKVTITDFGLAKQKRSDCSKMTSVVGTILYSCPEIVQNQPYGEKADIWALGCILYQMCTLRPPFFSSNMLTLATKIVEADFTPIPKEEYSARLIQTVTSCICASAEKRPDVLQLAGSVVDIMLVHMDNCRIHQTSLERKLERERKRTQRHFSEANQNMQNYHRLFLVSQERYDKLANLAGSGGASSLKDETESGETVFPYPDAYHGPKHGSMSSNGTNQEEELFDRGWTSDDESCPSSGSESRESSAGSTRSGGLPVIRRIRTTGALTPTHNGTPPGSLQQELVDVSLSQLTLDIPNTVKASRDSGISSGDPSPNNSNYASVSSSAHIPNSSDSPNLQGITCSNPHLADHLTEELRKKFHRSNSTPTVNPLRPKRKTTKRPSSTTATLSISPSRVRQISDPILQMLHQLHKIIYISQLPPTLCPNPKRRVIERFKRALFAPQSTTFNLKSELRKLLIGSKDIIDMNLGPSDNKRVGSAGSDYEISSSFSGDELVTSQYDPDYKEVGTTYEQIQSIIESTLVASGYYSMSPNAREKTPPLGPISMDVRARQKWESQTTCT
ncbi:hypothetical protein ScPMuIL_016363 [Solemya velum]